MFTITVPNPDFSGERLGLQFTRGQAQTDDIELANLFKSTGYRVEKTKNKKPETITSATAANSTRP